MILAVLPPSVVPPPGVGDLERPAARSWRGLEAERYGDWLVVASNAGALALYGRLGFTENHRYHYRLAPESRRPPA
jgi:hypothetical protein